MNTNPAQGGRVAQPADEEIKKHGDQLARQVRDASKESGKDGADDAVEDGDGDGGGGDGGGDGGD